MQNRKQPRNQKPEININQLITGSNDDGNQFLDELKLQQVFGNKPETDFDEDDPTLDELAYVLVEKRIDSKNIKRTIKPYAPWVCHSCGFDVAEINNIKISEATQEQLDQVKPVFERLINKHRFEAHKGLAPSKAITKRDYLKAQKYGAELAPI